MVRLFHKIRRFIKNMLYRNRQTLNGTRPEPNKVTIEYWQERVNIGDQLSPAVVNWMLEQRGLINRCSRPKHLNAIDSIIGFRKYDAVIWGSGVLDMDFAKSIFNFGKLIRYDVRAVRGPFTRDVLMLAGHEVPQVYGDPAILLPLIYNPDISEKCYEASVIHHFTVPKSLNDNEAHTIEVATDDYHYFVEEILKSKRVISSSLHGIIVAEAYGVPAIFLSENQETTIQKYIDWYHSTNRTEIKIARSINEAIRMEPMPIPDLRKMQQDLMEAFPDDIFEKK